MEPAGSGATWTGSPKGVFAGRKHHKPRLSLKNNTALVREREDANRTREAGNRDEVEGVVANTLKLLRNGAVGFIDWLDLASTQLPSLIVLLTFWVFGLVTVNQLRSLLLSKIRGRGDPIELKSAQLAFCRFS